MAEDLQLEEELLLLQQSSVRGVHGCFIGLLLLVWWDVLVVLQLLHTGLGLLAFLTAALVRSRFLLALLEETMIMNLFVIT